MLICCIIKPHALLYSKEILQILSEKHVFVRRTKRLYYTDALIHILYDHMSAPAREAIASHLVDQTGLSVLLDAPSIAYLLEITGTESDPNKCAPSTIRERFGVHDAPAIVGADPWWENAIHRPINAREAMRDLWHVFRIRRSYE